MYKVINELFKKAKEGDENSKVILVSKLNPLIQSSIKKYCPIWDYYEDLYQDGVLIVLECITIYKEERGTYLNFVKNYLRYYYLNTFKYLIKNESNISLEEKYYDEGFTIEDFLSDDFNMEEFYLNLERNTALKKVLKSLTLRQRQIIILFYYYELSLGDISEILNISKWTVVNTKRRALEKLKEGYFVY